jgi:predicted RNase H-like HicB family nuclease
VNWAVFLRHQCVSCQIGFGRVNKDGVHMRMKVKVVKLSEGNGYYASCSSLPGCVAKTQNMAEIEEKMREAISGYLYSMDSSEAGQFVMDVNQHEDVLEKPSIV